jgi:ubiquinone/menaquinone biosynthesis C-methylase UbiE
MEMNPFEIKDICRNKLTRYLIRAVSAIPRKQKYTILDLGCGSGVPTIVLSQHFDSIIYAVDIDERALNHLKGKIAKLNLKDRILIFQQSVFEIDFADKYFDIVLAEGLLNIIGFEKGLQLVNPLIKDQGYFVIHDEVKDYDEKIEIIKRYGLSLIHSFILDEHIWWNDYYRCLEEYFQSLNDKIVLTQFDNENKEIEKYRNQPALFKSVYYLLKKI